MSFPPGTEMFQFPGFASAAYGFSGGSSRRRGLPHSEILGSKPARGSPRLFAACHVLHRLLAPRHPPDALAFLDPPQRQPHRPTPRLAPGTSESPPPPGWTVQATTSLYKKPSRQERTQEPAYPCHLTRLPTDGRRGADASLASARPRNDARRLERTFMPADGLLSPPYDVQRTEPNIPDRRRHPSGYRSRAAGEGLPFRDGRAKNPSHEGTHRHDASLVGLGRLERPTSRLSGVRSNQLSYRPESHPFDRRCEAATRDGRKLAHPPGGRSHASGGDHGCAKGRADGGGPLCSRRCVNIAAWAAPRAEARSTGPKGAP